MNLPRTAGLERFWASCLMINTGHVIHVVKAGGA